MLRTIRWIARHLGLPEDRRESEAGTLLRRTDLDAMTRSLEARLVKQ